jgi:cytosine/adenosine deaminase-related metal-dependent hydrolase
MLERAMLISMKNGLRRDDLLVRVLRMCSENGARLLHISDYGLSSGCDASFVLVRAQSAAECVAQAPKDRIVLNHGQIL